MAYPDAPIEKRRLTFVWLFVLCVFMVATMCGSMFLMRENASMPPSEPQTEREAVADDFKGIQSVAHDNSAMNAASHDRMVRELKAIVGKTLEKTNYLGDQRLVALQRELASAPTDDRYLIYGKHVQVAGELLRLGREAEAIEHYRTAQSLFKEIVSSLPRDEAFKQATNLHFAAAVAYMRWAETQNCCKNNSPDSCILPIRGGGIHANVNGAKAAIHHLETLLRTQKTGNREYFRAKWLLNLAHMTLGQYPQRVPKSFLIQTDSFESTLPFPRFENVAAKLGVDTFGLSGGVVADDFDGDDHVDLFVTSYHPEVSPRLFRNQGDGTYVDHTSRVGLTGIAGGLNAIQADYDNDGDTDIFVLRGGWFGEHGSHPNSLLQNQGDGTFVDVTFSAGLGEHHYPTQTGVWWDFDLDGQIDLFIGNEQEGSVVAPSQLFRNQGDGTFIDVASDAGVTNDRFAKGVTSGDFNGDRYPDLYVSNLGQPNRLYRSNRDGTFTDVAREAGVDLPLSSFPAWFWDFNNDGNLDLYVSNYQASIEHLSFVYSGQEHRGETQRLYAGDGQGTFTDMTKQSGLNVPTLPMGCNFGDVNNDGFLDFYLGTGDPSYASLMPNVMYISNKGSSFDDVTMAGGFGHLQKGHAVAFVDYDSDGDLDVFEQMGGAYLGDKFYDALFENPGFDHHWLVVKLVGMSSNRSAIGARIRIDTDYQGETISQFRHVNSGASFGANALRQHIGLGKATSIRKLHIDWPSIGETQTLSDVPVDCTIEIVEGVDEIKVISK